MLDEVTYKRPDGSFVGVVNGLPYHIEATDPLFQQAQEIGANAPFEPAPEVITPTNEAVNTERHRRLEAGVDITLTDGVTVIPLQGRDEDMRNLHGLCTAATLRLSQGDTTHQTIFRDRDNNDWPLVPAQIVDLWSRGAAWVSDVYQASWAIKDADPIPADYDDDSRWP